MVSAIIRAYPGGRAKAAAHLGLELKKFDNHAYENNNARPLNDLQLCQLEATAHTTFLPEFIASLYGGIFVKVADVDALDNVELYAMSMVTSAKRGAVDLEIAKALADGSISSAEAEEIMHAHEAHMSARHTEVLSAIALHRARAGVAA
ncbi:YmfL family putative regulatory protein [Pseudomonas sp. NBRC 111125]|uniref:YmfL family putative regulatory protein n=1 Tax=Pseudomonas sp. NBRC 111125 TaxID=1661040 RepID=UPI000AAC586F|nr:YmfL family putative regulatory protein [Pseudomonas sp. NBRC 111125]